MTVIAVGALAPWPSWAREPRVLINDVTRLNPVWVKQVLVPTSTAEICQALATSDDPVSIGGGCYSMGGQIAAQDSLHLDMRQLNQVVSFAPERRAIRVQSGIRWRDLQTVIDPYDLSVKIMQSYADFTVGGALSVNAHGRYVGAGPLINSVRSLQLVLANGSVVEASRQENADLFHGAIGGYGALGVITEVELDLVPNVVMERHVEHMPLAAYLAFFNEQVRGSAKAILHNADLAPPHFDQAVCVTWRETNKKLTVNDRLVPAQASYKLERAAMWSITRLPGGPLIRQALIDPLRYRGAAVVHRNYEASLDVTSLGPIATQHDTYALQEYFVPIAQFGPFAMRMAEILQAHKANVINVSVRHAPRETESYLCWAREEVFSFVLFYWQRTAPEACLEVGRWTRELIDCALALGGTYYLPYQLHATREQFSAAYPGARRLRDLKAKVDPGNRLRNKLLEHYFPV
nr:FAD-binding oxidoreductase [Pseudomonas sp. PDM20]